METSNKSKWMGKLEMAVQMRRPKTASILCGTILKTPAVLIYLLLILMAFQVSAGEKFDGVYGNGREKLIIATGSPGELGLLKELAEAFAGQEDATICWKKAVKAGWATQRTLIGSNEFFVVGPMDDPAQVTSAKTVAEAYGKIAATKAKFFSRGDNSGTHKKEMAIWEKAGIRPEGDWYIVTRDFMRATLRRANAERGYFMTDSSTWYAEMRNSQNLNSSGVTDLSSTRIMPFASLLGRRLEHLSGRGLSSLSPRKEARKLSEIMERKPMGKLSTTTPPMRKSLSEINPCDSVRRKN